jgi:pyruvate dehydrogenase E2 component (dihydrolipoamide acetyltransferase)
MANKVIMPKQGLQMTEGTIIKWLVKEGGKVVKDEPLFEMEADKLTITIDAMESGTLLKIVRGEGETVPITETIAIVGNPGEDISALVGAPAASAAAPAEAPVAAAAAPAEAPAAVPMAAPADGRVFISPRAKMIAEEKGIDYKTIKGTGADGMIVERDVTAYAASAPAITPLAKKVAELSGVDTAAVAGSGAAGKIIKEDILKAIEAKKAGLAGGRKGTVVPFKGMRKVISDRMLESLRTNAQTSHRISVDMSEATRLREAYKKADKRISFNDIISLAVTRALLDYPEVNAEITADGILLKDYVNLGIAVAVDNGLIVPVIKAAALMTLEQLSLMTKELAEKAKAGKLQPGDYKGGSFTISNLGMFGLDSFVAIINPPETGILAVGRIAKQAVVTDDDEIVIRPMCELTLSYDHRVVDGAPAAQFLARVKQYLEQPYLLL